MGKSHASQYANFGSLLEDEPHVLYIILGILPVTERVEITKVEAILLTLDNAYDCKGDLAGYEGLA